MIFESNVLVTGGSGMIGHALQKIIPEAVFLPSRQCDLRNMKEVESLFTYYEPEYVIHLAAKVGGVASNTKHVAEFYTDNILINTNVLEAAYQFKTKKLISLLSTCVYPESSTFPLTEDQIHNGEPHKTSFGYSYAKRMLDIQSRAYRQQHGCNFITAIPSNTFGPYDNFDLNSSHVIPALIRKIHECRMTGRDVTLWGDGTALREFTFSEDVADIVLFLLQHYDGASPLNVGNTSEISIKELAEIISSLMEYDGDIIWDTEKPSGQHRKPSDNSKFMQLGWRQENYLNIKESLKKTCDWYKMNYPDIKGIRE